VNLWAFARVRRRSIRVHTDGPDQTIARQPAVAGIPVLIALRLQHNGAAAGVHYLVATGINTDGSLQIHDPNPQFASQHLNDYLYGFDGGGGKLTGTPHHSLRAGFERRIRIYGQLEGGVDIHSFGAYGRAMARRASI
jgi:hypothetical protein